MGIFGALELAVEILLFIWPVLFVCWLTESVIPLFIAILVTIALWVWVNFYGSDVFSLLSFLLEPFKVSLRI